MSSPPSDIVLAGSTITTSDQYLWIGPSAGDWSNAANWEDLTIAEVPATAAPGISNSVTFNSSTSQFQAILGNGVAASGTFNGDNAIENVLTIGTLVAPSGTIEVLAGGTLLATIATLGTGNEFLTISGSNAEAVFGTLDVNDFNFGGLTVTNSAYVQAASLDLAGLTNNAIAIGSNATIEVGSAGGAQAGELTIDAGHTLTSTGSGDSISGTVVNNGSIQISPNAYQAGFGSSLGLVGLAGTGDVTVGSGQVLTISGAVLGGQTITLAGSADLTVGATIAAGSTIVFGGTGDVVTFSATPGTTEAGAITGFGATDAIIVPGSISAASDTANGLILQNGTTIVGTIDLIGSYSGDSFLIIPVGSSSTEIVLSPSTLASVSSGTSGNSYVWVGPISGDWNVASNWKNVTTAANPAPVAPGSADKVTFSSLTSAFQAILGDGFAATATFTGDNAIENVLTIGTLVAPSGTIEVLAGGTLLATIATLGTGNEFLTISGSNAEAVFGTLDVNDFNFGGLTATSSAYVQAASLDLAGLTNNAIAIGSNATIEVGSAGGAQAGELTIDAGHTLTSTGSGDSISGTVVNNGSIQISPNAYQAGFGSSLGLVGLAGTGDVTVGSGQVLTISGAVLGGQTITLAGSADLTVGATIAAGSTIVFGGTGDVVTFSATPGTTEAGAITGFGATDAIIVPGSISAASDTANGLILQNGTTIVGTIDLIGSYSGDSFLIIPVGSSSTEIVLSPSTLASVSSGTSGNSYVWVGPISGDWNVASNWKNVTTAANPAPVAPGSADKVTFSSLTSAFQAILGDGFAATATFTGDNAIENVLTIGTLVAPSGTIEVLAGGTLLATIATLGTGNEFLTISGSNAEAVFGTLDVNDFNFGGLTATSSAYVQAASLDLAGLTNNAIAIGSNATIEVGSAGGAQAGELTIDAGHTLTSTGSGDSISGTVVNNGSIQISPNAYQAGFGSSLGLVGLAGTGDVTVGSGQVLTISGAVLGGQTITLAGSADLTVGAAIAAGSTIVFGGTSDVVTFSAAPGTTEAGAMTGFGDTDAIIVPGSITAATETGGGLILQSGTTIVSTIDLIGSFSADTFLTIPVSATTTQIVLYDAAVTSIGSAITLVPASGRTVTLSELFADTNIVSGGTISTLDLNGPGTLSAAGTFAVGTLALGSGANLSAQGGTFATSAVALSAGAEFVGSGRITGTVAANGTINASGGMLELTGNVTGSGELELSAGGTLALDSTLGSGEQVAFTAGSAETLILGTPGSFLANAITGLSAGDRIELGGGATITGVSTLVAGTLALQLLGGGTYDLNDLAFGAGVTSVTSGIDLVTGDSYVQAVACYCPGTLIRTSSGDIPIDALRIGDQVITHAGQIRPIHWIGRRSYGGRFVAGNPDIKPIRIRAGALADGVPQRDLLVSPRHAMYINDTLIPASALVNGVSIQQLDGVERVDYIHLELDTHDVILAEGAPSESFVDDDSRGMFHNSAEYWNLYPDAARVPAQYCARRVTEGYQLAAIRRLIDQRAGLVSPPPQIPLRGFLDETGPLVLAGWAQNPWHPEAAVCLDLVVGGAVIAQILANRYRADLAAAGLGSGRHSFLYCLPMPLTQDQQASVEIRRSSDHIALPRSTQDARAA